MRGNGEVTWRPLPNSLEQLGHQLLDRPEDVLLLDEAHLDVELVELARRAVGAGVLVAEAGRDLEVAVEAGDHQQLLELLRGLRQRVELARVQPGGDQEVAGALGGGRGQDRGRHLVEAERRSSCGGCEAMTAERSMMLRCMRSRRRSRKRYSSRRSSLTPSSALIVKGSGSAAPSTSTSATSTSISPVGSSGLTLSAPRADDLAVDPDDGLLGQRAEGLVGGGAGAGDELHETVVVAQIDEEDAAQVTPIVQPAAQPDVGADVGGAELAAGVGPVPMHRSSNRRESGEELSGDGEDKRTGSDARSLSRGSPEATPGLTYRSRLPSRPARLVDSTHRRRPGR